MLVVVEIWSQGDRRPPVGAPIRVEARDTSLADAASETVATVEGEVRGTLGNWLDTVELDVPRHPERYTIWAHVDVDHDDRVSRGDFVTTAAHTIPPDSPARLVVTLQQV